MNIESVRFLPSDARSEVAAAIAQAQADLERAVAELDRLPALDTKSIFLTAHALNNFLTVSMGIVELLMAALRDYPDRQVRAWLESLTHSTTLMTHSVSQLISSTSASAPATLRVDHVDLTRLGERVYAYYRRAAELKGIRLAFQATRDVPTVRTDGVLVAAILDNLLSNALKYSPRGGSIWVTVRSERDGVECSVQDEGPGLSESEQASLFVPGVRLGPVPSAGEPSTGYGLAIAKRFAEQLGGTISCSSVAGQGATFSLWLPREGGRLAGGAGAGSGEQS